MAAANTPAEVLAMAELGDAPVQPDLRVRDVMAHRTDGVSPDMTVREALELMLKQGWRAVPVLGKRGEVLGILTEWDVMKAMLPEIPRAGDVEPEPEEEPELVRDAMTRSVLCVSEDMDLEEAALMMTNKNIEQFPVVNESVLTGILTRGDILRKLFGR
jgi:CBS domain-containing protein